jgi:hypothetical protein
MIPIIRLIRAIYPAMLILAAAYRYGVEKYGDGTWQDAIPSDHIEKALGNIERWRKGDTGDDPVLVDACLRLMFAVSVAVTNGIVPNQYIKETNNET